MPPAYLAVLEEQGAWAPWVIAAVLMPVRGDTVDCRGFARVGLEDAPSSRPMSKLA
jgi:hypothetical protein